MEQESVTFFYELCDLCRLCLKNSAVHNIFDGGNDNLSQDIFTFTGVKVSCNDNLPQKICKICLDVINHVKELKRLALVNENNLRLLFKDECSNNFNEIQEVKNEPMKEISNVLIKTEQNFDIYNASPIVYLNEVNEANPIRIRKDLFVTSTHQIDEGEGGYSVDQPSSSDAVMLLGETCLLMNSSISGDFKCFECNKTFNKRCYLTQHNNAHHSNSKTLKCTICGKGFANQATLNEHFAKHTDNKPCKCPQCPKSFNHKTDLRRHMYLHSGNKPYTCNICGKSFIREDHMSKHRLTHFKKKTEL